MIHCSKDYDTFYLDQSKCEPCELFPKFDDARVFCFVFTLNMVSNSRVRSRKTRFWSYSKWSREALMPTINQKSDCRLVNNSYEYVIYSLDLLAWSVLYCIVAFLNFVRSSLEGFQTRI